MVKPVESSRSVFLIGCPRSATSVFAWALAEHPDMWTGPEADFPYYFSSSGEIDRVWKLASSREGRLAGFAQVRSGGILACLGLGIDHIFLRRSGGKRWVDSTSENTLVGPQLMLLFPHTQFIHIIRDGRLVVSSMIHSGFDTAWATDFGLACETWVSFVRAGLEFQETVPQRVLEVRQERFASDPDTVMRKVQEFLGLEYSGRPSHFLRTYRINSSYGNKSPADVKKSKPLSVIPKTPWKSWTPSQKAIFREIAGPTMTDVGYVVSLD